MDFEKMLQLKSMNIDLNGLFHTSKGNIVKMGHNGILLDDEAINQICSLFSGDNLKENYIFMDLNYVYVLENNSEKVYKFPYQTNEYDEIVIDVNNIEHSSIANKLLLIMGWRKEGDITFVVDSENGDNRGWGIVQSFNDKINGYSVKLPNLLIGSISKAREVLIQEEMNKEMKPLRIADLIEKSIVNKGISKREFADILGVKYKTLLSKLNSDTFSAYELLMAAKFLKIDLNEILSEYYTEQIVDSEDIEHITNLLEYGVTMGMSPDWKLESIDPEGYIFTREELQSIAEQIKELGNLAGTVYVNDLRKWKLSLQYDFKRELQEQVQQEESVWGEHAEVEPVEAELLNGW